MTEGSHQWTEGYCDILDGLSTFLQVKLASIPFVIGTEPDRSPHPSVLHFYLFDAASVSAVKIYACENSHSKLQVAYKISLVADVLCSIWNTDDSFRSSSFISRQKLMSSPNVWPNVSVLQEQQKHEFAPEECSSN
ncbi:unnamed protein product [Prunus brigantina]